MPKTPDRATIVHANVLEERAMIKKLRGVIEETTDDGVILDIGGVGYFVYTSDSLRQSVVVGESVVMRTHHVFRQDSQFLCGFIGKEELSIFESLLSVQGVGIKSAMSVLSRLSCQEFAMAVANQDSTMLCVANGIGKKMAGRILLELKDKTLLKIKDACIEQKPHINDAVMGLISLGYTKENIYKVIFTIAERIGKTPSANDIILAYLKAIQQ